MLSPSVGLVLAASVLSAALLVVLLLYRRFRRLGDAVSPAFAAVAAIAVTLGALTAIGGIGHTAAVVSAALKREYGPSVILLFTTGAMLLYCGGMNMAIHPAIRVGRSWAVGVSAATGVLFCFYLVLLLPLRSGSSPRIFLGLWTLYLVGLAAASLVRRRAGGVT